MVDARHALLFAALAAVLLATVPEKAAAAATVNGCECLHSFSCACV